VASKEEIQMRQVASHVRRHLVGYLALFVALSGTSYAATSLLPRNSVGTKQVIDHSLLKVDFKAGQLPRGPAGPQGAAGAQGAKGDAGAQGAQGAAGAQGPKGDTGAAQGPQGATGPQGPQGATGPAGATGSAGPAGATNVTVRKNNSGNEDVPAGGLFSASVSCAAGEVATGGGGMSQFGDTETPLSIVVTVASRPTPSSGTPTGWAVTFKNVDTTSHFLGHIIYVVCASP
jgi:hypothetical protein